MDAAPYFKGKKITLMGLGLLGRGLGDAVYLANCGAELIVTDLKPAREFEDSRARLRAFPDITFIFGEHRLEDFQNRDLILKAAGVPIDSLYIAEAKRNRIPVRMSADLFAEYAGIPVIGVTGTRGKSTVTHMIGAVLAAAGKKVLLGGNVRGVSTLALLEKVQGNEIAVLELDSWQLQGFGEAHRSPHIAVFTTFYPDHLNYYGDSMDSYLADKANIFLYQKPKDLLILGSQCAGVVQNAYQKQFAGKFEVWDANDLPKLWKLQIPGTHNRYNAALALGVARAMDIDDIITRKALVAFKAVPGRLEFLREVNGVKIYNDNNSTTPEATIAALEALDPDRKCNIVLIMGGNDKALSMDGMREAVQAHAKDVVFLAGTGTDRIRFDAWDKPVFGSLQDAFAAARSAAAPGDILLFSPAFSSFGMFRNEYDRSDQFSKLVQEL